MFFFIRPVLHPVCPLVLHHTVSHKHHHTPCTPITTPRTTPRFVQHSNLDKAMPIPTSPNGRLIEFYSGLFPAITTNLTPDSDSQTRHMNLNHHNPEAKTRTWYTLGCTLIHWWLEELGTTWRFMINKIQVGIGCGSFETTRQAR
jgi:hypothetical protein